MFKHLTRSLVKQLRLHRDIARLEGLDDHLLADCGIPREHIARFVRGQLP